MIAALPVPTRPRCAQTSRPRSRSGRTNCWPAAEGRPPRAAARAPTARRARSSARRPGGGARRGPRRGAWRPSTPRPRHAPPKPALAPPPMHARTPRTHETAWEKAGVGTRGVDSPVAPEEGPTRRQYGRPGRRCGWPALEREVPADTPPCRATRPVPCPGHSPHHQKHKNPSRGALSSPQHYQVGPGRRGELLRAAQALEEGVAHVGEAQPPQPCELQPFHEDAPGSQAWNN